jgi:hypothetical protein
LNARRIKFTTSKIQDEYTREIPMAKLEAIIPKIIRYNICIPFSLIQNAASSTGFSFGTTLPKGQLTGAVGRRLPFVSVCIFSLPLHEGTDNPNQTCTNCSTDQIASEDTAEKSTESNKDDRVRVDVFHKDSLVSWTYSCTQGV